MEKFCLARDLMGGTVSKNYDIMAKETLRLGDRVMLRGMEAVVDALTQTFAGVLVLGGGYEMVEYEDLEAYV